VKRLVDLERKVAELFAKPTQKDWRRAVGMFEGSEFIAQFDSEVLAAREAEREAARQGRLD
jgi:hypothetical protein